MQNVICTSCKKEIYTKFSKKGDKIRCPYCKNIIIIQDGADDYKSLKNEEYSFYKTSSEKTNIKKNLESSDIHNKIDNDMPESGDGSLASWGNNCYITTNKLILENNSVSLNHIESVHIKEIVNEEKEDKKTTAGALLVLGIFATIWGGGLGAPLLLAAVIYFIISLFKNKKTKSYSVYGFRTSGAIFDVIKTEDKDLAINIYNLLT